MEGSRLSLPKNSKVKNAALELQKINSEFKEYKEAYEAKREKLQNLIIKYSDKEDSDEFDINSEYRLKVIKPTKIIWNIPKIEKKLGKEKANKLLERKYTINNWEDLIKYLKSCGVNPKHFLKFIDVEKSVDKNKLKELGDIGEVTMEDLSGCFRVEQISGYVKIFENEV